MVCLDGLQFECKQNDKEKFYFIVAQFFWNTEKKVKLRLIYDERVNTQTRWHAKSMQNAEARWGDVSQTERYDLRRSKAK